ncbi:MAG: hypothetical protein AAGA73_00955 [Pseudomonadota bacterium]
MTSALLLLVITGATAAALYVLMCFLQSLAQSVICSGCGLTLMDIAQFVPDDIDIVMMTTLTVSMTTSGFLAWRGWQDAMKWLHLA